MSSDYPGHNEQLVGEAVEPFRKEIVLATKLHFRGAVPFSPIASGLLTGKVTKNTKFEGDDVRKLVPQLSRDSLDAAPIPECGPDSRFQKQEAHFGEFASM